MLKFLSILRKNLPLMSYQMKSFNTDSLVPKHFSEINNNIMKELSSYPNQAIIWSLLEGPNKGKLYQLPSGKSIILIENSPEPFIFIAGELNEDDYKVASKVSNKDPYLYCNPKHHRWFLTHDWEIHLRIQLQYTSNKTPSIEKGLYIEPINNMDFFKQCHWFNVTSERFGSAENFLKYGIGYALCNKNQILSEAYSDYCGKEYIEMGIVTHPDFREKGAGTVIGSFFAKKCLELGKIPVWSCNASNLPSLRTAFNIGFSIEKYYVHMVQNDEMIKNNPGVDKTGEAESIFNLDLPTPKVLGNDENSSD